MIKLDAGKGLGDAIYLRAIVLHLLRKGKELTVFTPWPDMFLDLAVEIRPLSQAEDQKDGMRHASTSGHMIAGDGADEFTMRCLSAGIHEPVDLVIDWKVRNTALLRRIKQAAGGRRILIYQPLKVTKNPEQELQRPGREAFGRFVAEHHEYFRIKIGHLPFVEADPGLPCELDMFGRGFIYDTFDIGTIGDLFFGEPCFVPLMGEAMDKKFVCMFSRRALESDAWVRNLTPDRCFHKKHLGTAIYDA